MVSENLPQCFLIFLVLAVSDGEIWTAFPFRMARSRSFRRKKIHAWGLVGWKQPFVPLNSWTGKWLLLGHFHIDSGVSCTGGGQTERGENNFFRAWIREGAKPCKRWWVATKIWWKALVALQWVHHFGSHNSFFCKEFNPIMGWTLSYVKWFNKWFTFFKMVFNMSVRLPAGHTSSVR